MKIQKKYQFILLLLCLSILTISVNAEVRNIPDTKEVLPSWSPDGQWILFHSYGVMNDGIFIVRPDGSDLQKIGGGEYASWSPDSKKVIFTMTFFNSTDLSTGNVEIAVWDIKTRNITRLTSNSLEEKSPKFSPDEKQIVFQVKWDGLYNMNFGGTNLIKLVDNASSPVWSPDGKKIAYYTYDKMNEVWIMTQDGAYKNKIYFDYKNSIYDRYRWTPDSKYLLLNNGSTTITKVNIDNTSDIEYIYDPVAPLNPEYSPDGKYITFISNRDGGDYDLFVAQSNGSDLYRLVYDTNPGLQNRTPAYFYKISRPTPPPWPTPEPTPEVTSTAGPANTSEAGRTPSIPGFTALVMVGALVSLFLIKRR